MRAGPIAMWLTTRARARGLFLFRDVEIGDRPGENFGGHADGLGQRRMRVDRLADVFGIAAHFDRQRDFGDQVARVRPDDAAADDPLRLLVEDQLGDAFIASERKRAAAGRPRKRPPCRT